MESSVIRKFRTTVADGKTYDTKFCMPDAIPSVGYRANSEQVTQFRIWATNTLKKFVTKDFVLDDERLKQDRHFGKDIVINCLNAFVRSVPAKESSVKRLPTCMP